MKFPAALLLAAAAGCSLAQEADPLKSAACAQALAVLEQQRAASGTGVTALRERALQACLGGTREATRAPRVLRAPIEVPPPVITPSQAAPAPAAPALLPPPVAIQRPPAVAHCDASGCWPDDGRGLRHLGAVPGGPRPPCTAQGGLVYCP